jgi:glutathione S-transferase
VLADLLLVDKMEQVLWEAHWLVDGTYPLADIAAAPFIARIAELASDAFSDAPRVTDWCQRMQQRPAYAQAHIERFGGALKERAKEI